VNGVVYGDWFLPSKGELNQMRVNRVAIGGFWDGAYWSSSEYGSSHAMQQYFVNGMQSNDGKNVTYYVRPVRAF
jgi:hypothetical protein